MGDGRVIVIGAGVGGLAAAIALAGRGVEVEVHERAEAPGGKLRELFVDGVAIDSGPTVLTMRWVFEELFAHAGSSLAANLELRRAGLLARHAWGPDKRLDLHAELARSAEAIGAFAGRDEARRFLAFAAEAAAVYRTLEEPYLRGSRPTPFSLASRVGPRRFGELLGLQPFTTLWRALGRHFRDPRLRQLFGRYSTYCGSSPFAAPATLMLVAHVEQEGVWYVSGGMQRLAEALAGLAQRLGVTLHCSSEVVRVRVERGRARGVQLANGEQRAAAAVIANVDVSAFAAGRLGADTRRAVAPVRPAHRSLSALTWSMHARGEGFPLLRHNVFFSSDYPREFDELFRHSRLPSEPTVYVCAQDREDGGLESGVARERLFCLVNAPAIGNAGTDPKEYEACEDRTFRQLERLGLRIERSPERARRTTPQDFARLFPGSGGALYGRATHGWAASFLRPTSRSAIPGLYLAGGSVHPGPGVPMAALSGRQAATSVLQDLASTARSRPAGTPGGTSTQSTTRPGTH
jgi:1-hydroxycarotenoid 3,4-desaturase